MVRERYDQIKGKLEGFPWMGLANDHITVRAIKSEIDGALGAYGAWLLRPYQDKPGFEGQNTTPLTEVKGIAEMARDAGMQFCVHAIGDRGNRLVLDLFETMFEGQQLPNPWRWRIEHAQHLHPDDIPRFSSLGVIAAMQAVHCTSDAPFVVKRLGETRASEGAYAWRSLLDAGAVVTNGTDAPVEDVDPLKSFYASVTRKRAGEDEAFMPHQKITREEALYSYTMANAYAAFEEDIKGSLSKGKLADIVILDQDLRHCSDDSILQTRVLYTIVGGKVKFDHSENVQ
jgi:predicted amidohydrolase YtcJ